MADNAIHALFAELRRIKQEELPRQFTDPVQQAYHDERIRGAIRRVEEEIEREMNGMRSSMIKQTAEEIALRVNADEGEQLITNDGINCFATWIDENGNIRCGMRGGDNG